MSDTVYVFILKLMLIIRDSLIFYNIYSSCLETFAWLHYSNHSSSGRKKKKLNQCERVLLPPKGHTWPAPKLRQGIENVCNLSLSLLILHLYFWLQTWIQRNIFLLLTCSISISIQPAPFCSERSLDEVKYCFVVCFVECHSLLFLLFF